MSSFLSYFKKSPPSLKLFEGTEAEQKKYLKKLQWQSFIAATIGYSLYYVCRTSLNVVKQPIIDSGLLNAQQLGIIGSVLLFSYAGGKLVNGFLADHSNIKKFMAAGLIVSTLANLSIALLGFAVESFAFLSSLAFFLFFAILWGINGWSQSMGAAPAIISLSRWFPLNKRGTFYGFFSASHNFGEFLSFVFVGSIVGYFGWELGFFGASMAGFLGILIIIYFLHDTPESKGLPSIEVLSAEKTENPEKKDTKQIQKEVIRNPFVWILALASAFMYISRYAINSWGVLFLQEHKGYSLELATQIISINALLGIIGTVLSGWFSDKLFRGDRNFPALIFGVLNAISLTLFLFSGNSIWMNALSMILFGIAIGVLICFLGGLMAVDIVPRNATGAALGIVGIASYIGAGLQDIISGSLLESSKVSLGIINGVEKFQYDFKLASFFWIGASIVSFSLASLVMLKKKKPSN